MTRAKSGQPQADNSEVIRLTSDEINHKKLRTRKLHRFTILHYSPFKALWDWIVLLLVVYTAIFTPYSAAFLLQDDQKRSRLNKEAETRSPGGPSESYTNPLVIIDLIVDVMFIVDIFINFRTTFIDEQKGEVESDPAKIAKHYLKGWFLIDVLSAVPFDLLMFGLATDEGTTTAMGLLKTARLLRLLRVLRRVEDYSQYAPAVVILLMCAFSILAHWLACVWYAIGEQERSTISHGWLGILGQQTDQPYRNDSTGGPSLESRYLTSLYFTLTTLTSVGFGNVAPNTDLEKLFAITIMLVGSLMFAIIFGNMTAIIYRLYEEMSRHRHHMNLVKEFVKFHNVPDHLWARLKDYVIYSHTNLNGKDIEEVYGVMADFPDFLQADISLHLNRNLLRSCSAFQGVNHGCLRALSMRLQTTHTAPGDVLIHKGDKLLFMYFISRGSLEILQGNLVVAILGKNDVVGENFCKRQAIGRSKGTVRALTYCDLLSLSRSDLEDLCTLYPEFREHFAEKVQITIEMTDEDVDSELQPMMPEPRDMEAGKSSDPSTLPKKRRIGADLHQRVTLTPHVAGKDSASRGTDETVFKGNRQSPMLFLQMQIERGHMAQENVQTVQVSMEDIPTITEENNNGDDEASYGRTDRQTDRRRKPKHVNFHPSTSTTPLPVHAASSKVPTSTYPPLGRPDVKLTQQGPTTGWQSYGASYPTNDAIITQANPRVVVDGVTSTGEGVHRRIDGLYDQLSTIESKFEEQRAAIIDFILSSSHVAQHHDPARYRGESIPLDANELSQPTPQDARSMLHDREGTRPGGRAVDEVPLVTLPPTKARDSPRKAPIASPEDDVPSFYQMQLPNTNVRGDKYNKSTAPRPGRRKSPSSGHVSTANWTERSPGRVIPAASIPAKSGAKSSADQPIWHERKEQDGSKHSSTDC